MAFKVFASLKDSVVLVESPCSSCLADEHAHEKVQLGGQQGSISSAGRFGSDFGRVTEEQRLVMRTENEGNTSAT